MRRFSNSLFQWNPPSCRPQCRLWPTLESLPLPPAEGSPRVGSLILPKSSKSMRPSVTTFYMRAIARPWSVAPRSEIEYEMMFISLSFLSNVCLINLCPRFPLRPFVSPSRFVLPRRGDRSKNGPSQVHGLDWPSIVSRGFHCCYNRLRALWI